jgi:hypothetical protein|tara:strand:- start:1578 stop:2162 length:585 start_codon:yes stop_codon:yes gene_type:complete
LYIAANLDDCALIIKDFLPLDLFKSVSNYDYNSRYSTKSSTKLWGEDLYKDDKGVKTLERVISFYNIASIRFNKIESEESIFKNVLQILKDCPFIPYNKKSDIVLNYYEYQKHSGINWHDDGQDTLNYSFYIHKEWNENWGGETLIDTNRGLPLSVTPHPNSLVVIKSGIRHKVCSVVGPEKRKVLQIKGSFYK